MSLISRVRTEVEYKGRFYPLWHVSHWDGPCLMAVVAPRGSGASEFIAQMEAFLDHRANTGSGAPAAPKFVAHNAKDLLPATNIEAMAAWNAIFRFTENPPLLSTSFAAESVMNRARFIVRHVSTIDESDLEPDQKQSKQTNLSSNVEAKNDVGQRLLADLKSSTATITDAHVRFYNALSSELRESLFGPSHIPPKVGTFKKVSRWVVDRDTGLWTKDQTAKPSAPPLHGGHRVAFLIHDRKTNTTYADVQ